MTSKGNRNSSKETSSDSSTSSPKRLSRRERPSEGISRQRDPSPEDLHEYEGLSKPDVDYKLVRGPRGAVGPRGPQGPPGPPGESIAEFPNAVYVPIFARIPDVESKTVNRTVTTTVRNTDGTVTTTSTVKAISNPSYNWSDDGVWLGTDTSSKEPFYFTYTNVKAASSIDGERVIGYPGERHPKGYRITRLMNDEVYYFDFRATLHRRLTANPTEEGPYIYWLEFEGFTINADDLDDIGKPRCKTSSSRDKPHYGDSPRHDKPHYGDSPRRDQPHYGDSPRRDQPHYGDSPQKGQPRYGDSPRRDKPQYGDSSKQGRGVRGKGDRRDCSPPRFEEREINFTFLVRDEYLYTTNLACLPSREKSGDHTEPSRDATIDDSCRIEESNFPPHLGTKYRVVLISTQPGRPVATSTLTTDPAAVTTLVGTSNPDPTILTHSTLITPDRTEGYRIRVLSGSYIQAYIGIDEPEHVMLTYVARVNACVANGKTKAILSGEGCAGQPSIGILTFTLDSFDSKTKLVSIPPTTMTCKFVMSVVRMQGRELPCITLCVNPDFPCYNSCAKGTHSACVADKDLIWETEGKMDYVTVGSGKKGLGFTRALNDAGTPYNSEDPTTITTIIRIQIPYIDVQQSRQRHKHGQYGAYGNY